MFELIRDHQLNIMLVLCGACGILVLLLFNTRFLNKSRKWVLIHMETVSALLLWFDRLAYIYAGNVGTKPYFMVRLSNFMVFFLTSATVFGLNMYVIDWLKNEGKMTSYPKRLMLTGALSALGMVMAVVSAFANVYYYFDETNTYHRGQGFLIAYIIPLLCPIIQFTVVQKYRKVFGKLVYISLLLFIFVPIACGILQIFTYGISIVNMAMVAVSIALYILMYLDLNNAVVHAHEIEIHNMQGEQIRMRRLFSQTANAFVSAVEKKDELSKGKSSRTAEYARRIALMAGKSDEEAEKVYYAALLHDVGLIGIPDSVINNDTDPDDRDVEAFRQKPVIGKEILSSITEYPYLSQGAHYSHERYDGSGYPDGLKGEEIPEIARIIAVADSFVTMTTKKRYREARPSFEAREAFVKGAGERYDPVFADIMVKIIDADTNKAALSNAENLEKEISCSEYREHISLGIPVESAVKRISFDCEMHKSVSENFSAPSIVLFDSYDGRIHDSKKAISGYHYQEYGEVWFNKYSITTEARKIEEKIIRDQGPFEGSGGSLHYEIIAGRYDDHLRLIMIAPGFEKEVIVALPGSSVASFIGLTGENCSLKNITVELTGESVHVGEIPRIAQPVSFIDHLESDIPNVQVDMWRSAFTEAIELKNKLKISFHTMSLPGATLVWHCPYVVIYSSDNGEVGGPNYHEYEQIKLNGEDQGDGEFAKNRFTMKKKPEFPGWDSWKKINQDGLECEIYLEKKGKQITFKSENLGISIENVTTLTDDASKIYVVLTGDHVALTDIRIE